MIIVIMQVRATLDYKMSFQRLKKKFFLLLYFTNIEVLLYIISSVSICLGWCNNTHYAWLINQHLFIKIWRQRSEIKVPADLVSGYINTHLLVVS